MLLGTVIPQANGDLHVRRNARNRAAEDVARHKTVAGIDQGRRRRRRKLHLHTVPMRIEGHGVQIYASMLGVFQHDAAKLFFCDTKPITHQQSHSTRKIV